MQINLTMTEIIAIGGLLIAIVSAWITLRVRITKVETTSNLKFLELEKQIHECKNSNRVWIDELKQSLKTFLDDNKGDHREIAGSVEALRDAISDMRVKIAELHNEQMR